MVLFAYTLKIQPFIASLALNEDVSATMGYLHDIKFMLLRRTFMNKKLLLILLCCLLPFISYAEPKNPHQIIQETAEKVLLALNSDAKNIRNNSNRINDLVDEIILPICDLERMGKYILSKHWKTASDTQRTEFMNEFKVMLIRTYAQHMAEYSNAKITVLPEKNTSKKQYRSVSTKLDLRNGSTPMHVDYVFRMTEDSAKIVDVRVEGMSILRTFRTAFTYEIAETSLDALIARLANMNRPSLAMNAIPN